MVMVLIRQGCPISGQLYSLAVEPLLCRLRDRISGLSLTGKFKPDPGFPTLSAYADDEFFLVSNQDDIQTLMHTLSLYEKASSSWMNWANSEAL